MGKPERFVQRTFALRSDGPGDAWAARSQITAPGVPAIGGGVIYDGARR